ncbi:MAG: transcription termination/antitermination protein NusA [Candidatus Hepatoplasma vulgare]|nr:MAG: transcription termination/antitermination protein NusA [Candidatus Hepatoplasma sp.]
MNIENPINFLNAIKLILEKNNVSKETLKQDLIEIFKKAFERDSIFLDWDKKSVIYEPANVSVEIDLENGKIDIERKYEVVDKLEDKKDQFIKISLNDERIKDMNLKVSDEFIEKINLKDLSIGKAQYIKQLLIQKTREVEKLKIFEQFKDKKNQILSAKVSKIQDNYLILDHFGTAIFVPKSELSELDKFRVGQLIKVFIVDVTKNSKDAQIIASRIKKEFVLKLLEQEIEDIEDKIITIDKIVRIPGVKTKIVVSSRVSEVDAIGSIIGLKGKRIKPIIDELRGERIDVIKNSDNVEDILAQAILPSKLEGIAIRENPEGKKEYTLIVKKDVFLSALGKRGLNAKLISNLVDARIEIKTVEDALKENVSWKNYESKLKNVKKRENADFNLENYDLEDFADMEDEYN